MNMSRPQSSTTPVLSRKQPAEHGGASRRPLGKLLHGVGIIAVSALLVAMTFRSSRMPSLSEYQPSSLVWLYHKGLSRSSRQRLKDFRIRATEKDDETPSGSSEAKALSVEVVDNSSKDAEVIGASSSRPSRLIFSPGVQGLVTLLTKLKDAPSDRGSDSALQVFLDNIPKSLQNEEESAPLSDDLQADFDEAVASAGDILGGQGSDDDSDDWKEPVKKLARLRIARRLPEVIDLLTPWDVIFPKTLAEKSGVRQDELRTTVRNFWKEVDLGEISSWSEEEMSEVDELLNKNASLKQVIDSLDEIVEKLTQQAFGQVATGALLVAAVPLVLLGIVIAACVACFGGFGGGGNAPVPSGSEFSNLPLYRLDK
eukprot:TRINITY_DN7345_c1_g1_i1.p1 TRINITY_DN7345_c1_g1~~TRINITY_DN7345_c1_g1_i1.p1  ORF type:complete len:370 (+),score=71.37 TRINITY_DN7345_c1_g1_i1:67-1176(+)